MANMTFIELTVNAFDNVFRDRSNKKSIARRGAGADSVRRPLRGIEVKDDTYAVMRVIRANGEEVPLVSSSYKGGHGPSYTNFILQSVSDSREEKSQIVETFGIPYIFFYGQRPHIIEVQAILINTLDFNWEAEFWENYDRYLRGTKCVEMGARVYLFYDDNIVEGYMMRASANKQAMDRGQQVAMQFSMLLTNYANVSLVESSTYPVRPSSMSAVYKGTDTLDGNYVEAIGGQLDGVTWLIEGELSREITGSINRQNAKTLVTRNSKGLPLRSDITDNQDEWTGDSMNTTSSDLAVYDDETYPVRDKYMNEQFWRRGNRLQQEEKARLTDKAMEEACARNAMANNPGFLRNMGLLGGGAPGAIAGRVGAGVGFGAGAGVGVGAGAGAFAGGGVFAGAGGAFGGAAGAGAYAGAGAWSGAGVGPGGAWSGSGTWSGSYAGAGAGYYGGQGVGYSPFGQSIQGTGGQIGFHAGAGYYGPGQYGTPGYGSGTSPASLGFGGYSAGAGSYAGWSPGGGSSGGTYSYGGQTPPGYMPPSPGYAGPAWMPSPNYSGYGVMAGYSAGSSSSTGVGVQQGYAGGMGASFGAGVGFGAGGYSGSYGGGAFYGGAGSYAAYASPGYAAGGYGGGTASSQYYSGTYAGWDPVNGSYSGNYSGTPGNMNYNGTGPRNTYGPMPGQPGGGLFTTQSFPTGNSPVVTKPGAGASQSNPYAKIDPQRCKDRADFLKGGPG